MATKPTFQREILNSKVGQTDLVLVCNESSLVGLCVHDYKSLRAVVTIYATLVDPKFDINTDPCP